MKIVEVQVHKSIPARENSRKAKLGTKHKSQNKE